MRVFFLFTLAIAAAMCPRPSAAAELSGNGSVSIVQPLGLTPVRPIDFGDVVLGPGGLGGTVQVEAATSAVTTTGGLTVIDGTASAGHFLGLGTGHFLTVLTMPRTLVLSHATLPDTLTATTDVAAPWTPFFGSTYFRFFPPAGLMQIHIGAELTVPDDAPVGVYEGDYTITLNYY